MARLRVEQINPAILRECREQIGLSLQQAQKKEPSLKNIEKIERGEIQPTFNQLAKLAGLYHVPQWVFLKEELPNRYRFNESIPAFRQFADSSHAFDHHSVRVLTANVARFRELILELRNDMEEPIPPFSPPAVIADIPKLALAVRKWLRRSEIEFCPFEDWKNAFEDKGVFVFITSKFKGWSKVDPNLFRGFSIYKNTLPIIVINNSDALRAQSFTLFHELGHLLKKESVFDVEGSSESGAERWCDKFAGEVLMPQTSFRQAAKAFSLTDTVPEQLRQIKKISGTFHVSPYACIVRMRHLSIVDRQRYEAIENLLKEEYRQSKEVQRNLNAPISRNIAKEVFNQYGSIYSRVVVQAYQNREIGLHKLCKLLGIKRASHALKLQAFL